MGYFKPATLSFTAPRDFFDNVGKNAPVTNIHIELPREYLDYNSVPAGQTAPYTPQPVDPAILAEIQTAVMRQYGGVARQCLGAFRQGGSLSGLALVNRTASLDQGVGMRYSAQFGREMIGIHVSAEAARKLLGTTESTGYMLVLYGDKQLAYAPMSSLNIGFPTGGNWTHQTKTESYWGEPDWWGSTGDYTDIGFMFNVVQMKFDTEFHAVFTNAKIVSGVLDSNAQAYAVDYSVKLFVGNSKRSIHEWVSPALPMYDYSWLAAPAINGSGKKIYDSLGNVYSVNGAGIISLDYDRTADDKLSFRMPTYVSPTGERYGGQIRFGSNPDISGGQDPWFTAGQQVAYGAISNPLPVSGSITYGRAYWGGLNYVNDGPGNSVSLTYVNPELQTVDFGTYLYHWVYYPSASSSVSLKYPIYSNNGVVDTVSAVDVTHSLSVAQTPTLAGDGTPTNLSTTVTLSVPFYEMTSTVNSPTPSDYTGIYISVASWFPGYNGKGWGWLDEYAVSSESHSLYTPYSGLQTGGDRFTVVELWHCSNGKHCLQSFFTRTNSSGGGSRSAWLNGRNVTSALGAVGGGIDNIRAVFFDIKKSDIDKLK